MSSHPARGASHVLILIGAPGKQSVSEAAVSAAVAEMTGAGAVPYMVRWLERGTACELPLNGPPPGNLQEKLRDRLAPYALDFAILPAEGRRKMLLVADMDSTIVSVECLDELADFAGLKPQISAITERAMRGELPFESALEKRVAMLAGLDADMLERAYAERVRFTSGAAVLIATMKTHGARTVLVSGGFSWFTERVAKGLGFDAHHANRLEIADGALTGHVVPPILGRDAKRRLLEQERKRAGLAPGNTMAVGDGANDLDMLREAGLGVAFHAKPAVAASARITINHGDLTALLFLQGYSRTQFAHTGRQGSVTP